MGSSPSLLDMHPMSPAVLVACALSGRECMALGKLAMEELHLLGKEQVNAPV